MYRSRGIGPIGFNWLIIVCNVFRASFGIQEEEFGASKQSRAFTDRKEVFKHYFEADHPFIFLVWYEQGCQMAYFSNQNSNVG
jgi:hypothetical protein